jgi:IS5 family transposase
LTRLLDRAKEEFGLRILFQNHTKRAKRRLLGIMNSRSKKDRRSKYVDLIKVTNKSIGYAQSAIEAIDKVASISNGLLALRLDLNQYCQLAARVVDQTQRRVLFGENVPAADKVVSLFETHTDIIVKDRRDTFFGHKICLTGGASNLIVDCLIVDGNPADSSLTVDMLDRQKLLYGRYPLKVALDGGFASKDNLNKAKEKQIKDVCFAKKRGLEVEDMCRSQWVYDRLRRFRAGIESGISWVKRCFGMTRCTWKGLRSFKSYVWASIVSANLLTLARKQVA